MFLELLALFFVITTIYRRVVRPFIQGMRGEKKSNGQAARPGRKFNSSSPKKNIKTVDPMEIQDAEFEEIK